MPPKVLMKYSSTHDDPSLRRWRLSLAQGSHLTVEVAMKRAGGVCELFDTYPQGLSETGRRNVKRLQGSLEDLVPDWGLSTSRRGI